MDSSTGGVELGVWLCVAMTLFLPDSLSLSHNCPMLFQGNSWEMCGFSHERGQCSPLPTYYPHPSVCYWGLNLRLSVWKTNHLPLSYIFLAFSFFFLSATSCSCTVYLTDFCTLLCIFSILLHEVSQKVEATLLVQGMGRAWKIQQLFLWSRGVPLDTVTPFEQLSIAPALCSPQICMDRSQCFASIRISRVSKLTEFS